MRVRQGLLAILLALGPAGCVVFTMPLRMGPVDEILVPGPDTCGLAGLGDLRGRPLASLADYRPPGPLRVLWPGQEITNEIEPARINAEVDVSGRILRLICG